MTISEVTKVLKDYFTPEELLEFLGYTEVDVLVDDLEPTISDNLEGIIKRLQWDGIV